MGSGPDDRRDGEAPAGVTAGAGVGDRVTAAVGELYGADPEGFTGRRGELAAAARDAGDRAAAKVITSLRRPTRAAWVVNRLARADRGAPEKLAELAAARRAAQQAGHGPRLRELSAARGALVDALTAQALAVAGVPEPPPSLRLEVAETLTAAIADPAVAADFAAGTLTRAVQWSGFGVLPPADADAAEDGSTDKPDAGDAAGAAAGPVPRQPSGQSSHRPSPGQPYGRSHGAPPGAPAAGRSRARTAPGQAAAPGAAPGAARRQAELDERLAREAAERAARRREQYQEAERLVASTAAANAEAGSAEDRLEAEVRDLEQRLTQARSDLAAARMRARHAEAAERRARQALDRLPSE